MAGMTAAVGNKALDHVNGLTPFTEPTAPLKVRLMTANGTGTAAGTEVAGGTYTAQPVTLAAASGGVSTNTATVTFSGMPACTVVGVEIWDSAAAPLRLWWGPLTAPKIMNAGDTFTIDIGALTLSLT
jgi:hypothetical protein